MTTTAPTLLPLSPERVAALNELPGNAGTAALLVAVGLEFLSDPPVGMVIPSDPPAVLYDTDSHLIGVLGGSGDMLRALGWVGYQQPDERAAWLIGQVLWVATPLELEALLPPGQSLIHQLLRTPGADAALLRTAHQVAEHLPADAPVLDPVAAIAALTEDPRLAEQHAAMVASELDARNRALSQLRRLTLPWMAEATAANLVDGVGDADTGVAALRRGAKGNHYAETAAWLGLCPIQYALLVAGSAHIHGPAVIAVWLLAAWNVRTCVRLVTFLSARQSLLGTWASRVSADPGCKVRERGYAGVEAGSSLL